MPQTAVLPDPQARERETFARWKALLAYDPSTGALTWLPRGVAWWDAQNAGHEAGFVDHATGYRYLTLDGRKWLAHRVAWFLHHGHWPQGQIDHQDGVRTNNAMANLRDVSAQDNQRNRARSAANKSGVIGVSWDKSRGVWIAIIKADGRSKTLGRFRSIRDAERARLKAERSLGYHPNHGMRKVG